MVPYGEKENPLNDIAEPDTTLLDEGRYFRVIAEFPKISEERIHIDVENSVLILSATEPESGKKYQKMITLPLDVRLDQKKFQNGVLDLTLEKKTRKSG